MQLDANQGRRESNLNKDAAALFNQDQVDKNRIPEWKSREKMICMRIDDFLAMAKPGHQSWKIDRIEGAIAEGAKLSDIPILIAYTGYHDAVLEVCGHEGRHRAKVLKSMGFETMPVLLKSDIRWSEQNDPQRFDWRERWPDTLISEDKQSSIPFPVSRKDAMTPYAHSPLPNTLQVRMQTAQALLDACNVNELPAHTIEQWNQTRNDGGEPQKEASLKGWIKEDVGTLTKEFYAQDDSNESLGVYRKAWAYFDGETIYDIVIQDADYQEVWTPDIEQAKATVIDSFEGSAAHKKPAQMGM